MEIDQEKVEQAVLALLYLTSFKDRLGLRAWKGHNWEVMNLLHEKGYISNPASKAKSVALTKQGAQRSKELFEKLFGLTEARQQGVLSEELSGNPPNQDLARKCAMKIQFRGQNHRPTREVLVERPGCLALGILIGSLVSRME